MWNLTWTLTILAVTTGTAFATVSCYTGGKCASTSIPCYTESAKCVTWTVENAVVKGCSDLFFFVTPAVGCQSVDEVASLTNQLCVCSGNNCNGSGKISESIILSVMTAAVTKLIMK